MQFPIVLVRTQPQRCAFRFCMVLVAPVIAAPPSSPKPPTPRGHSVQHRLMTFMSDSVWRTAVEVTHEIGCPIGHVAPRLRAMEKRGHTLERRRRRGAPPTGGAPHTEYRLTLSEAALRVAQENELARERRCIVLSLNAARDRARWRAELGPLVAAGLTAKEIAFKLQISHTATNQRLARLGLQAASEKRRRFCCARHRRLEHYYVEWMQRALKARIKKPRVKKECDVCARTFYTRRPARLVCTKRCRREKKALKDKIRHAARRGYVA